MFFFVELDSCPFRVKGKKSEAIDPKQENISVKFCFVFVNFYDVYVLVREGKLFNYDNRLR